MRQQFAGRPTVEADSVSRKLVAGGDVKHTSSCLTSVSSGAGLLSRPRSPRPSISQVLSV